MKHPPTVAPLANVCLNHIEFYSDNAIATSAQLAERYGFTPVATSGRIGGGSDHFSVALRQGAAIFVITEPQSARHPARAYLDSHGDGVADIAFRVPGARTAYEQAVRRGARPWTMGPAAPGYPGAIHGFGDVRHSFIEAPAPGQAFVLPGFPRIGGQAPRAGTGVEGIDHLAVCLESGDLTPTTRFYESALGFRMVFEERIAVGTQAMLSTVVQSPSHAITLTLLQPDPAADRGQLDDFLHGHGGAGVQHIALRTDDAVRTVSQLVERGVGFLATPDAYYRLLAGRLAVRGHELAELRACGLLVDQDQSGELFQIFARSTHPRSTFFFEIIERLGARTFGSANIKALYEAVEAERLRTRVLA